MYGALQLRIVLPMTSYIPVVKRKRTEKTRTLIFIKFYLLFARLPIFSAPTMPYTTRVIWLVREPER